MPLHPSEYKTVQARILAYAQAIGWTYVLRAEAERRRRFDHSRAPPARQAAEASPYFDDLLDAQVRKFNPRYAEAPGALVGDLRRVHADIAGKARKSPEKGRRGKGRRGKGDIVHVLSRGALMYDVPISASPFPRPFSAKQASPPGRALAVGTRGLLHRRSLQ